MWLGLAISLAFIPGYTGASIPTSWAVLSCVLPLVLWRPLSFTAVHWALGSFLLYAYVSWFWATNHDDAVMALWTLSILAGCFCYGATLPSLNGILRGLALGFSFSSAVAVAQWLGYQPVLGNFIAPSGLVYNSALHGEILALIIIGLVIEREWLWIPALIPGLILSQSRGAYAAIIVGLILTRIRHPILLAIGAAGVAYWATLTIGSSDSERFVIWRGAIHYLTFFGNGPGSFLSLWFNHPGGNIITPEYVHNDALQLAFEYGIGACIPLSLAGLLLIQYEEREWPLFAVFIFLGLFSFPLYSPITSVIGTLAAGRIARDWALVRRRLSLCGPSIVQRNYAA